MANQDIILRKLKLANDLLGNCGLARELFERYPDRESLAPFLQDYKKHLSAALQMFEEVMKEKG